jgi:hypothetical protein
MDGTINTHTKDVYVISLSGNINHMDVMGELNLDGSRISKQISNKYDLQVG